MSKDLPRTILPGVFFDQGVHHLHGALAQLRQGPAAGSYTLVVAGNSGATGNEFRPHCDPEFDIMMAANKTL